MRWPDMHDWLHVDDEQSHLLDLCQDVYFPLTRKRVPSKRRIQGERSKSKKSRRAGSTDKEEERRKENVNSSTKPETREVVTSQTDGKKDKQQQQEKSVKDVDGERRLAEIDARGIAPDDIQVKTNAADGVITVTTRRRHMTFFGPITTERRQVLPFPEGVEADDIRSFMTPDDTLVIALKKERVEEPEAARDDVTKHEDEQKEQHYVTMDDDVMEEREEEVATDERESTELEARAHVDGDDSFEVVDDATRDATEVAREKSDADVRGSESAKQMDDVVARVAMRGFDASDVSVRLAEGGRSVEVVGEREERDEDGVWLHRVVRSIPLKREGALARVEHRVDDDGTVTVIAKESTVEAVQQ